MKNKMNHAPFKFNFLPSNNKLLKIMLFVIAAALCIDARGLSLCFVAIRTHASNTVYDVQDRQGSTNVVGVIEYLDRCVAYTSTNLHVHVKIDKGVPFSDVAPLLKACKERNLSRIILYWPVTADGEGFTSQLITFWEDTQDSYMLPTIDGKEKPVNRRVVKEDLKIERGDRPTK